MPEISSLPAFKLVVLRVIAHFVHDSLDETISLAEMTSVINKNPLITLARQNFVSSSSTTISIRDVIIALMAMFQGSEIRILENKDQFKLRLNRSQFNEMIKRCQKEYDELIVNEIEKLEKEYEDESKQIKTSNRKLVVLSNNLIDSITSLKYSSTFLKPVDDSVAPNYHKLIKDPTDLKTIRAKVKDGRIQTKDELQREILLMYANAIMYNKSNTDVFEWSLEMVAETEKLWDLLEQDI